MIRDWLKRRWLPDMCDELERERTGRDAADEAYRQARESFERDLARHETRRTRNRATIAALSNQLIHEQQTRNNERARWIEKTDKLSAEIDTWRLRAVRAGDELDAVREQLDTLTAERRQWLDHQAAVDASAQAAEDRTADVDADREREVTS